jgi:two-component system, OmpR family, sensor kinase
MSRVPVRVRLVLAFAAVMAVVLAATGLFVYLRVADELTDTIDRELRARVAGVVAIVRDDGDDLGDPREDPLEAVDPGAFVQVLDSDGMVAGTTEPAVATTPVLSARQLDDLAGGRTLDVSIPALDAELRLAAASAEDDGVRFTVIVGASLAQRELALADLGRVLLLGGPIALVLAALAGYGVAAGALRPVEHMRRRAAELFAAGESGKRLPVPPARDEIANLGTTLNAMLARIERAFERERAFTADASHELRTPLSILKAEIDLALAGERSHAELMAALRSASEETDRLTCLAEDLLVLARADDGRLPLSMEPVDLRALAERVAGRFSARAAEQGRSLRVNVEGQVTADPLRLEQALTNLVDNALRYGAGDVDVQTRSVAEHVELHVCDAGTGFPEELRARVFDRFVRADGSAERGGAGLGLSIVAAIARAHGGTVHAANAPDGGADVWISLPATTNRPLIAPGDHGHMVNPTGGAS